MTTSLFDRRIQRRTLLKAGLAIGALNLASPLAGAAMAAPERRGGTDRGNIKIGNIMPYSGPASAYGTIGQTEAAYFKMINAEGGINGRRIDFISYDDGYSPPKAVEQARRLVEDDNVLLIFNSLGTPSNTAIQHYMNEKKVPQLFIATGANKWNDPKHFPWTMGWQPSYQSEARVYAKYLLKHNPNGKIAILYQNDDYGKDYLKGFKDGIGDKLKILSELSYDTTEPTVDSEMISLQASGADVFFDVTTPKFAAQAIKKAAELNWHPLHILNNVSTSVGAVMKPAGFDHAKGVLSTAYLKDPTDPQWKNDPAYKTWLSFMEKYYPDGDRTSAFTIYGYTVAETMAHVLRVCGDDLSRENIMKQAAGLHDLKLGLLLPGITVNTGPDDFAPIKQLQMMRFAGDRWELFGPVINGEISNS
ncbi:MAG: ABC transporter substrate-binding protein [Rhizobiales bacterium]|nr:ABC transporter substrate-binding protein [Hyphomicrobiales bacterium]